MKSVAHKECDLHLVADNAQPRQKSHLDIAIENKFLTDITNLMVSPEGDEFHLSLKASIRGYGSALWINEFGSKEHVTDQAIASLRAVAKTGSPSDPNQLKDFEEQLVSFRSSNTRILILPPKGHFDYGI